MVLVDTSVWIRFLANRNPYAAALDELLERDEVAGHDLIYGELVMGDSGNRRKLLESYSFVRRLLTVPHQEVVTFVHARHLQGRGIGWTDAHLLAAVMVSGARLFTADLRLAELARGLGVEYCPSPA